MAQAEKQAIQAVHVVGGGLAGSEAAWQIAAAGVPVVLHEMRPDADDRRAQDRRPGRTGLLQLVPLRRSRAPTRSGCCTRRCAGSARWSCAPADANQVPAGGALAVDRDGFSAAVTAALTAHPLIEIRREEVAICRRPNGTASSSRPARSPRRRSPMRSARLTGEDALAFFDAIAPIVHRDSIDMAIAWFQSRYDKAGPGGSGADYINCPLDREQYDALRRRR